MRSRNSREKNGWAGSASKKQNAKAVHGIGEHKAPVAAKADADAQRKRTGLMTWPGLCSGLAGWWVGQRMRTHSDHGTTAGLVRGVVSMLWHSR
jgi:hypothetical protein